MNRVELTGRIATDIDLRKTQSNKSVTEFSLAVETNRKDEDGRRIAEFFRVQVWEAGAEFLNNYAGKGVLIAVEGRLKADQYTNQQGNKVTKTYVQAEHVEICNKPQPKETHEQTNLNLYHENEIRKAEKPNNTLELNEEDYPFY